MLPHERAKVMAGMSDEALFQAANDAWWFTARPEQLAPPGDWDRWLLLAGRGFGKSKSVYEWLVERIIRYPMDRSGSPTEHLVVAPSIADCQNISITGPSGLLKILRREGVAHHYVKSPRPLILIGEQETKIHFVGADKGDIGRGYNLFSVVMDELCIAAGQTVVTFRGDVPIEQVAVGDMVMTSTGWAAVVRSERTGVQVPVVRVITDFGETVMTGSHPVRVGDKWVRADRLRPGDTVTVWTTQSIETPSPLLSQLSSCGTERPGITTSAPGTTTTGTGRCCTVPSGPVSMDRFQTGTRSTTSIAGGTTTDSKTWKSSPSVITGHSPNTSGTTRSECHELSQSLQVADSGECGQNDSRCCACASSADTSTALSPCGPRPAQTSADERRLGGMRQTFVLRVEKVDQPADVYDLETAGAPEFFAGSGGLLVHNCKFQYAYEIWYGGLLPALRADVDGDHPRTVIATTPKPMPLIMEWVKEHRQGDPSIALTRGSTFDNADNLSLAALNQLKKRYEGTNLGQQELEGILLESLDGPLFSWIHIENNRVEPPIFIGSEHKTVGIDPCLTGGDDGDLMGVVVVFRAADDDMYVVADESEKLSGGAAARHIWKVFARHEADDIVIEDNLAKQWLRKVMEDTYYEMVKEGIFPEYTTPPIKTVHSQHGKKLRAEPVSLRYEQGRVHHVGKFQELEDEMLTFDPLSSKASPDRLDALVHACRHLMGGEGQSVRIFSPVHVPVGPSAPLWTPGQGGIW